MWSGTSALSNIDQSLQTLRNEVVRLDTQLTQLSDALAADQRYRLKLIKDIAAVRLQEIASGELAANLTAADVQAADLLAQRDDALSELNARIEVLNQQLAQSEASRAEMLQGLNQQSQAIVDVEAKVQHNLNNDQNYLAHLQAARDAESVLVEAERKVAQAQGDMAEKAKPYQADELFMYLWQCGFATTDYQGGLFRRFVDAWVARLINFSEARLNYWNLSEIPRRLGEHADRIAAQADQQHMTVQQLEIDALTAAGLDTLTAQLEQARREVDQHDDALEELEAQLNELLAERAGFLAGQDPFMQACLQRLSQALQHQDLHAIHQYVLETRSNNDDQLLAELRSLQDRVQHADQDLADVRQLHSAKLDKLKELEKVRRNFKNSRYDDVRSGFGNKALIASVLGQFVQGLVSGADLWRTIERNQRYRNVGSLPDFGSDGLGDLADLGELLGGGSLGGVGGGDLGRARKRRPRARRRSTWNWPSPRRGGGAFKIPRGGGGGGGGFKTGGSF